MSKKYCVIAVDDNIDYYSLVPITCYSWQKLGYTPIVIQVIKKEDDKKIPNIHQFCGNAIFDVMYGIDGLRDSTTAQISRLFACCLPYINDEDIIITGDADMVMGKDIFTEEADIVSYGFNITGRTEIPICYVKATKAKWRELMQIENNNADFEYEIKRQSPQNARSDNWELYWSSDQQLLTQRAKEYGMDKILFVDRAGDGNNSGLPLGRWDRYKWEYIPPEIVDVHVIRSPLHNWDKITDMCKHLWPEDDLTWVMKLEKELNKV